MTKVEPSLPVIRIESKREPLRSQLREFWRFRELLYFLAWRDVKVKYRQAVFGIMWAVVQPLLMMLLFTSIFGRMAQVRTNDVPYPLFAFAGVLPWLFFANSVAEAGNSLIQNTDLITKVYVPRLMIPIAAVAVCILDFLIGCVLLGVLMAWYGIPATGALLWFPAFVIVLASFSTAVGTWASALNVKYRDIRYALPFVVQLWFFATPVIYSASMIPPKWRGLLFLNPLAGIIEGLRWSLFGGELHWGPIATAAALTFGALMFTFLYFRRTEIGFADTI